MKLMMQASGPQIDSLSVSDTLSFVFIGENDSLTGGPIANHYCVSFSDNHLFRMCFK